MLSVVGAGGAVVGIVITSGVVIGAGGAVVGSVIT